jgi:VanZ family protein
MKSMIRKFVLYWLPPLAVMGIIFTLSSRQNIGVSDLHIINFVVFKTLHVCEYGLLTFLFFRALTKTTQLTFPDTATIAALMTLLYGISDEIHQTFVPSRSGGPRDIFIDLIGILLMYLLLRIFYSRLSKYMY